MDWAIGLLVGLAIGLGSWIRTSLVQQEQAQWMQRPATERAAYEESEAAEWLRGAGGPEVALRRLEATLPRCLAAADTRCEAMIEDALGRHFQEVGQPEVALAHFRRGQDAAARGHHRALEGRTLAGLGSTFRELGDARRAQELLDQALVIAEGAGDLRGQALTQGALGAVDRDLGRRKQALEAFGRSLELYDADWRGHAHSGSFLEGGSSPGGAAALANLGAAYRDTGNLEASLQYYRWALAAFERLDNRRGAAVTLLNMGAVERDRGDAARALAYDERALVQLHTLRHRVGEAQAAAGLARLLAGSSPSRAIFHGKQAVAIHEAVRGEIRGLGPAVQDRYASSVAGAYRRLAGLLAARARIPEAQEVLSLLKGREFFEFIRRDAAEAAEGALPWTPAEQAARERYEELSVRLGIVQRDLAKLRRKRFLSTTRRDLAVELPLGPALTPEETARLSALQGDEARALAAFERFFADLEATLTAEAGRVPERLVASTELARVLAVLGPGHVGVYTLVEEDAVRMLLVTPAGQQAFTSPLTPGELTSAVLALRVALEDPRSDPQPAAARIYDAIVRPMARDLDEAGAGTIVWSLDGVLRYLPMGALHDGHGWLVERYRSVVFPGGDLASLGVPPRRPWSASGFGVTKAHEGFTSLPGVREELAAVVRGEQGGGVLPGEALVDEAFTLASFAAALEHPHPVVHVASHFLFRPGDETRSFLLLGDGSHLTLGEVRAMPARFQGIDQVTLSACESAIQGGDGAEVDGLAVLVERKGAASVLASLWPVADVVTPSYMRAFYSRRESGMSRAAALQSVQVDMIRGELRAPGRPPGSPGWAHPFFWAPFILLGDAL